MLSILFSAIFPHLRHLYLAAQIFLLILCLSTKLLLFFSDWSLSHAAARARQRKPRRRAPRLTPARHGNAAGALVAAPELSRSFRRWPKGKAQVCGMVGTCGLSRGLCRPDGAPHTPNGSMRMARRFHPLALCTGNKADREIRTYQLPGKNQAMRQEQGNPYRACFFRQETGTAFPPAFAHETVRAVKPFAPSLIPINSTRSHHDKSSGASCRRQYRCFPPL